MAKHPKVVAIGEIGLDFHYNHSNTKIQKEIFIQQLELAKSINLPAGVHSRNADNETFTSIASISGSRGVIHCFASDLKQAMRIINLGYYISFTGLLTFVDELANVDTEEGGAQILTLDLIFNSIGMHSERDGPDAIIIIGS